ncbi:MAG: hypothetical protein PHT07_06450 [Paludibacter sp.]|nr:hypothetical protein [Paludibacter sp.]
MKRFKLSFIVIFIVVLRAYSQKEVYFNTTKSDDIQVESMHGIEIGSSISTLHLFQPIYYNDNSLIIPLSMGYFCEKRIAPSWTIISSIKLGHNFMKMPHYVFFKDSSSYQEPVLYFTSQKISNYKFEYQLGISLGIEPRWYFGYKKRYQEGKAKLNSGWFLSVPVSVGATLINTYKPDMQDGQDSIFSNYKEYCSFAISGTLGYRQAITKQLFLEGNVRLLSTSSTFSELNNKFYLTQPTIHFFPGILIKAAYTFKK